MVLDHRIPQNPALVERMYLIQLDRGEPWKALEQESVIIRAMLEKRRWQPVAGWIEVSQEVAGLFKRLIQ